MSSLDIKVRAHTDLINRISERQLVWLDPINPKHVFHVNGAQRVRILTWIDQHTTGYFYFDGSTVAFLNEEDAIMFKLGYKDD